MFYLERVQVKKKKRRRTKESVFILNTVKKHFFFVIWCVERVKRDKDFLTRRLHHIGAKHKQAKRVNVVMCFSSPVQILADLSRSKCFVYNTLST